ncbi:hypothetical protein J4460_00900 [Candidatus Woesearchaeota archaeon]|nr:MAG: hypothetical protein QS99_C0002G0006 [archaeon GW2011_AR4]MBS3129208.1 hypothetical protein [Candidatus Woesearchaeota archaeon]HIH39033.1 hypothetical protein [Candidatus Woesearchaeota archaeon]HIH48340.1 hypothetical protein [Candidatus Woesearchaeota archaeon]HIJ04068.1 hypothetical protein [Candidatus Woesearchaeota archaeon]
MGDELRRTSIVAVTHDPDSLESIMNELADSQIEVEVFMDTTPDLYGRLHSYGAPDFFMTGLPFNVNGMKQLSDVYRSSGYTLPPIIIRTSMCPEDLLQSEQDIFLSPATVAYEKLLAACRSDETSYREHMAAWALVKYIAFVVPKDAGAEGIARGIDAYHSRMAELTRR